MRRFFSSDLIGVVLSLAAWIVVALISVIALRPVMTHA
jgi:hypothetical protein